MSVLQGFHILQARFMVTRLKYITSQSWTDSAQYSGRSKGMSTILGLMSDNLILQSCFSLQITLMVYRTNHNSVVLR